MTQETIPPRCTHWDEDDEGLPTFQCRGTATHHSCCYFTVQHINVCFKHRCRCEGQRSAHALPKGGSDGT